MKLTPAQLKGRIKSLAQKNHADARILLRIFMMERLLERISVSPYRDHFIIKGGILVTSMISVALRSTMDIDASIKNENLSEEHLLQMLAEISAIDLVDDGISFRVKRAEQIMDEMEYPGIRVTMEATLDADSLEARHFDWRCHYAARNPIRLQAPDGRPQHPALVVQSRNDSRGKNADHPGTWRLEHADA